VSHHDSLSVAAVSADGVRPHDALTQVLREVAATALLPDPERLSPESADQDPLSAEGLVLQTDRLVVLIRRAKGQEDSTLLRSLRRELLVTRYALAQSSGLPPPVPRPGRGQARIRKTRGAARENADISSGDPPRQP